MSREFFTQIDDELRGLLGPRLRHYESVRGAQLLKLWYGDPAVHFEVQLVSRRWSPAKGAVIEIGLHLEHADAASNDRGLAGIMARRAAWRDKLPGAEAGPALGPRAAVWRRISEFLEGAAAGDPELASEAAERLAAYVRALAPLVSEAGRETRGLGMNPG